MDSIDRANEYRDFYNSVAMQNHYAARTRPDEEPIYIDGVRCCIDCEDPISEERLRAKPNAVRCTECQQRRERLG